MDVKSQALSQDDFLKILVPKLEAVKKEQDRNELLSKKLLEVKFSPNCPPLADFIRLSSSGWTIQEQ